jgi:thiol-disulfide isomerase/thioredoxin
MIVRFILLLLLFPFSSLSDPPTLLIFTGSDWCPNCRRLEKKILSDTAFINYAKNRLLIEFADFPQHKKQDPGTIEKNKALAKKYNFQGIYPTILILDNDGKMEGRIQYKNQTVKEFIDELIAIFRK